MDDLWVKRLLHNTLLYHVLNSIGDFVKYIRTHLKFKEERRARIITNPFPKRFFKNEREGAINHSFANALIDYMILWVKEVACMKQAFQTGTTRFLWGNLIEEGNKNIFLEKVISFPKNNIFFFNIFIFQLYTHNNIWQR